MKGVAGVRCGRDAWARAATSYCPPLMGGGAERRDAGGLRGRQAKSETKGTAGPRADATSDVVDGWRAGGLVWAALVTAQDAQAGVRGAIVWGDGGACRDCGRARAGLAGGLIARQPPALRGSIRAASTGDVRRLARLRSPPATAQAAGAIRRPTRCPGARGIGVPETETILELAYTPRRGS